MNTEVHLLSINDDEDSSLLSYKDNKNRIATLQSPGKFLKFGNNS
jgi:uncharacterized protein YaaQ